jgi:hypothetical protein
VKVAVDGVLLLLEVPIHCCQYGYIDHKYIAYLSSMGVFRCPIFTLTPNSGQTGQYTTRFPCGRPVRIRSIPNACPRRISSTIHLQIRTTRRNDA